MKFASAVLATLLATVSLASHADVLTLDQGRVYSSNYDNGGMGGGRGVSFLSNETFHMTAMGIDLSVLAANQDYRLEVYSSNNGHDVGALLASTTFGLNAGEGYQDQALDFTFAENSYYVINFTNTSIGLGNLGTIYSWEDPGSFVPYNYGVLTLIEGFEGMTPDSGNPLLPHMRLEIAAANDVPEPGTLALISLGLLGCGALRKRAAKTAGR